MSEKTLITCREATNFISQKEEGKITFSQRIKLAIHLLICEFCKLFYKQNKFLAKNFLNLKTEDSLTEEEQTKITRTIEENSAQE